MKAIIMAAGVGSRISRHVDKPKCLLEIEGKSILSRTVDMLIRNDIAPVVVAGYQHQQLESNLAGREVTVLRNPFFRVTNSLGSLWFARDFIPRDETLFLMNADVFWEQDIMDILLREKKDAVLLADSSLARLRDGDYFFGCDGEKIVKYGKDLARSIRTHEYVGVAKVEPAFLPHFTARLEQLIEEEHYDYWWENILYSCSEERDIYIRDIAGLYWAEVDYIEDYERIMEYVWKKKQKE